MRGLRRRHGRSMRDIEPGLRGMGTRMAQAEDRFIDNVSRIGGISKAAAAKVLAVYRKHRVVKMNAVSAGKPVASSRLRNATCAVGDIRSASSTITR